MKRILFVLFVLIVCMALSESPALLAGPQKVLICHVPPGNPANAHVISVSANAVAAHLAHGDCLAAEDAVPVQRCECNGWIPTVSAR